MIEDIIAPLDIGDGTPEQVLAGVAQTAEDLVDAVNAINALLVDVRQHAAGGEGELDTAADVDLYEWVTWLRRSYRLGGPISAKWMDTAGVRQELQALHAGWCAAYKTDGTPLPGTDAISWHESLDHALDRIRKHSTRDEYKDGVEPPPWITATGWPPDLI